VRIGDSVSVISDRFQYRQAPPKAEISHMYVLGIFSFLILVVGV